MYRLNQVPQASIKIATSLGVLACAIAMCGCTKMRPPEFAKLLEQNAFTDEFNKPVDVDDRQRLQQAINSSENVATPTSRRQESVDLELDRTNGMRPVAAKPSDELDSHADHASDLYKSEMLVNLPEPATKTTSQNFPASLPQHSATGATTSLSHQQRSAARLLQQKGGPINSGSVANTDTPATKTTQSPIILKSPEFAPPANTNGQPHNVARQGQSIMPRNLQTQAAPTLQPRVNEQNQLNNVKLASGLASTRSARHQLQPISGNFSEMPSVDPELMLLPIPVSEVPKSTTNTTTEPQADVVEKAITESAAVEMVEPNTVASHEVQASPESAENYTPQMDLVIPAATPDHVLAPTDTPIENLSSSDEATPTVDETTAPTTITGSLNAANQSTSTDFWPHSDGVATEERTWTPESTQQTDPPTFSPTETAIVPSTENVNNEPAFLPASLPPTNTGAFETANDFEGTNTTTPHASELPTQQTIPSTDFSVSEGPVDTAPSLDSAPCSKPCCAKDNCDGCSGCDTDIDHKSQPIDASQDSNQFVPINTEQPTAAPDCDGCESFDCSSVIPPFAEAPEHANPFHPMVTRTPLKQRQFQASDFIASSTTLDENSFPTSQATYIAPELPNGVAANNTFQPVSPGTAGGGNRFIERHSNFEPAPIEVKESEKSDPPSEWQQNILESIDSVIERLKSDAENSETAHSRTRTEARIDFLSTTRQELEHFRGDPLQADSAWQLRNSALLDVVKIQLAGPNHPKTKSALKVLLNRLEKQAPLKLVNASFCTKVKGFGQFTPHGDQSFAPGQQSLLYCEIENFVTDEDTERGFRTRLSGGFMVTNEMDEIVQQANFAPVNDFANRPRRDFYIHLPITVGELEPGQYTLQLIITDHVGNKSASLGAPLKFDVR